VSIQKDKLLDNSNGWQKALKDAQTMLFEANCRRNELRDTIKIIRTKIAKGEPWPGESATHQLAHHQNGGGEAILDSRSIKLSRGLCEGARRVPDNHENGRKT
jgi:hypothetical protein